VITFARPGRAAPAVIGICRGGARQTARRGSGYLELVSVDRRRLPHVIDDQDFVRQIEDEIPLILWPREAQLHRLELEDQIISERTVKPEMLVLGACEQMDQRTHHREYRGLAA